MIQTIKGKKGNNESQFQTRKNKETRLFPESYLSIYKDGYPKIKKVKDWINIDPLFILQAVNKKEIRTAKTEYSSFILNDTATDILIEVLALKHPEAYLKFVASM